MATANASRSHEPDLVSTNRNEGGNKAACRMGVNWAGIELPVAAVHRMEETLTEIPQENSSEKLTEFAHTLISAQMELQQEILTLRFTNTTMAEP